MSIESASEPIPTSPVSASYSVELEGLSGQYPVHSDVVIDGLRVVGSAYPAGWFSIPDGAEVGPGVPVARFHEGARSFSFQVP